MSRIESILRTVAASVSLSGNEFRTSAQDIEMAGEIHSALLKFYLTFPAQKGPHLPRFPQHDRLPKNLSVTFGAHRIGREEIRREHLPGNYIAYFYDIQDSLDSNLRWGIEIDPVRVRFFQSLRRGGYEQIDYSAQVGIDKMEEIRQSFQEMTKKPFSNDLAFRIVNAGTDQ